MSIPAYRIFSITLLFQNNEIPQSRLMKSSYERITKSRILLLYRNWLKLSVKFPKSVLVALNNHVQMNEKALTIVRQRFRENKDIAEPKKMRLLVQEGERSLAMMRRMVKNKAQKQYPATRHPQYNLFSTASLWEMFLENTKCYLKEFYFNYIQRRW